MVASKTKRPRLHTGASKEKHKNKLIRSFNFMFRYIDDAISLNSFGDFVDRIYPIEIKVNVTTDTEGSGGSKS